MAKTLQFRRDTTTNLASVTGAVGELFVDTTKDTVVVMDGSTAGGFPLAKESDVPADLSDLTDTTNLIPADLSDLTDTTNLIPADLSDLTDTTNLIPTSLTDLGITDGTNGQVLTTNGSGSFTFTTATGGSSADFSEVAEDILPLFSEVYDIGSTNKRWYDGYFSNKVDIDGAEILGSPDGVVIPSAALIDQLLISDNMITPDDSSARQYLGDKGVVVVNGNMNVEGDWLGAPVVETVPEIIAINPGDVDTSFDSIFSVTGGGASVTTILEQPDGKIIVGGGFSSYNGTPQNSITRLNLDETVDNSFNTGSGFNGNPSKIAVQSDGKIIVCGDFTEFNGTTQNRITRLNSDGSRDTGFDPGSGFPNIARDVAIQSDGKIIVTGAFNTYNGTPQNFITRLNSDGSIDNTFSIGSGLNGLAFTIAVQSDGKILVGGSFTSYNGTTQNCITRLNSDGSLDNSFNVGTGFSNYITKIVVQPDGKILVVGGFTTYDGNTQNRIARLNSDGSLDNTFAIGTGFDVDTLQLELQSNGKIVVIGGFTAYDGNTQNRIARLNSDGSLDTSFNFTYTPVTAIFSLGRQSDDKILVGVYNGSVSVPLLRLYSESAPGQVGSTVPIGGETGFVRYNADISAFQAHNGASWELLERVTTPPTSLESAGTVDIDFTGSTLRTQGDLTGDITYAGSNYLTGSSVTVKVKNGSSSRNLTFPAGWVFVGGKPADISANKTGILTITSFGTTESDCVAAWAVQS